MLAAVLARRGGPRPEPADAPAAHFSATRAASALHEIIGDTPHPVGTPAHDAVRDRLAARLRTLGYDVAFQQRFACNPSAFCAPVTNLIARAPGQSGADSLLVAAHYDSVPAGPGASDDGLGIATLVEVARAVRAEHFRNTIVFLVTDAEEAGLLGAEGFVTDGDASKGIAAVINVDCRGSSGASYMFETSRNNRWLIPIVARSLPRPATSSLYFNIYELLPNDTDMTVFKRAGYAGVNFANIGGVVHYHTPLDSMANLSLPLLQHDGDHALAMLRALGDTDLRQTSDQNAVWFDVLSLFIIWWPQGLTVWLVIIALAMLIVGAALRVRENETTARAITFGVLAFFGALLLAFVAGFVLSRLAGARAHGATWVAYPLPAIAAMWLVGIGSTIAVFSLAARRAGFDGLFLGAGLCWSALSVAFLIALPGGTYLALVPAMVMAICALLRAIVDLDDAVIASISGGVAAVLHFPVAISFYTALGAPVLPVIAVVVALVMTAFVSMWRRAALPAFALALVAALLALGHPPYEPSSPRRLNVRYVDDGQPKWQLDALTPQLRAAAQFDAQAKNVSPWWSGNVKAYEAPAPALSLPPVEMRVLRDERAGNKRTLLVAVRSQRGAPRLSFMFHAASIESLRVNGVVPPPRTRGRDFLAPGWHRVIVRGAAEAQIEIVTSDMQPLEAVAADATYGLPPQGAPLARAREASICVPSDDGDVTQTMRRARL